MNLASLLDGITNAPALKESTLDERGLENVLIDAFRRMVAKVQRYIDTSLRLRKEYGERFRGLPPTELDASLQPTGKSTAAIDQQRQLYAAAHAALIDPAYASRVIAELVDWHEAFVRNFVVDTDEGPVVVGRAEFAADSGLRQNPTVLAHLRFTYAIEGSATLARVLAQAAEGNGVERGVYLGKAEEIADLTLSIGETFHRQFADPFVSGRYFLVERGRVPPGNPEEVAGLSHNNSQTYLIKGMEALAALNAPNEWNSRLTKLLEYIETRRDGSGFIHEFDFKAGGWNAAIVKRTTDEVGINWQAQNGHETVILGHTIAGLWEAPANRAARAGRRDEIDRLLRDFVATMNNVQGIHENGLPGNAFELIPTWSSSAKEEPWPEGSWQAELLWQFLLRAVEVGIDLARYEVRAGRTTLALDRVLARGLALHDATLFDGTFYVPETGKNVAQYGRQFAAPINHAAETVEALGRALVAYSGG